MNPIHSFLSMASLLPIPSELSLAYLATFIAETLATSLDSYLGSRALLSSEVTELSSSKRKVKGYGLVHVLLETILLLLTLLTLY